MSTKSKIESSIHFFLVTNLATTGPQSTQFANPQQEALVNALNAMKAYLLLFIPIDLADSTIQDQINAALMTLIQEIAHAG